MQTCGGLPSFQVYHPAVSCAHSLDRYLHQEAIQKATCRGADEVEIEVWEGPRFVGWLAVPAPRKTVDLWQKLTD
jgi:hypothetical protein